MVFKLILSKYFAMKFESEFNVRDEVYAFINNVPTKCIVRKVEFPTLTIWYAGHTNDCILYHLAPCKDLEDSVFNGCVIDTLKYEREVGKTIEELCNKIIKLYKK